MAGKDPFIRANQCHSMKAVRDELLLERLESGSADFPCNGGTLGCTWSSGSASTGQAYLREASWVTAPGSMSVLRRFCGKTIVSAAGARAARLAETDLGQTDFGHPYFPTLAKSDFGQTDFGQKNLTDFGQTDFGQL